MRSLTPLTAFAFASFMVPSLKAGLQGTAAKDTAEYVLKTFAKDAGEETVESLSTKISILAAKNGDEAVTAVRKVGPRAFRLAEEAGEQGKLAVRLMARAGDEAAYVVSDPKRLSIVARLGDDAAEAMIKHKGIAEPLLEAYSQPAIGVLKNVGGQNARRLAIMQEEGELAKIGKTPELFNVIGTYGDKAADFVWKNKGALAVGATLAAFLAEPKPFIDGVVAITDRSTQAVTEVTKEAVRKINWTAIASVILAMSGVGVIIWWTRFTRRRCGTLGPQPTEHTPTSR